MSQINDALKRAQATQQSPPPGNAPQWQPPAPEQAATRGIGLAVPFVFALIALLGLFFLWQVRQRHAAQNHAPVEAELATSASAAPENAAPVAVSNPQAAVTAPLEEKPIMSAPIAAPPAPQPATAPVPPAAPAPPPLRLQAVLFSGQNSSAMINGQTVMTGDNVGEYRVSAINRRSVTLISATRTNVLTLMQ